MNKLYFRVDKEVICFCETMFQRQYEINLQWKKDANWGNELVLNEDRIRADDVIACLTAVFMEYRLHEMIEKIVIGDYYYTDDMEVDKICELTNWVISEVNYARKIFDGHASIERYLADFFLKAIIGEEEVYYDTIVTFCAKSLVKKMQTAVAFAIDEYKREEEYQSFIQSVRVYIGRSLIKVESLHVLQGEYFAYYNEVGKKYSTAELRAMMEEEPLYILGLDENEMNLAPILTLSPRKIFLYGNDPSDAKTLSIINLFQEKVTFLPREEFPYHTEYLNGY